MPAPFPAKPFGPDEPNTTPQPPDPPVPPPPKPPKKKKRKKSSDATRYQLPDGTTLPPGKFPRVIEFRQGFIKQTIDIDSRRRMFTKLAKGFSGKPADSFKVLVTDDTPPKRAIFDQGAVLIEIRPRRAVFRRRSGLP